jgi:hypothetical protein
MIGNFMQTLFKMPECHEAITNQTMRGCLLTLFFQNNNLPFFQCCSLSLVLLSNERSRALSPLKNKSSRPKFHVSVGLQGSCILILDPDRFDLTVGSRRRLFS